MSHRRRHVVRVEVVESRRVPEAFGERVGVDLELGDELVLVGSDSGEDRLGKHKRVVKFSFQGGEVSGSRVADND